MELALAGSAGPDLRRADSVENIDQLLVEMALRIQGRARRDLADVHAGEPFHSLELDKGPLASRPRPRPARDRLHVLQPIAFYYGDTLLPHPELVARLPLHRLIPGWASCSTAENILLWSPCQIGR